MAKRKTPAHEIPDEIAQTAMSIQLNGRLFVAVPADLAHRLADENGGILPSYEELAARVASPLPADAREIVEAMAEAPMTKWSVHWITKARELLGMEPRYVTVGSRPVAGPADKERK